MTAAIFLTSAILLMASRKLIVSRKFGGCSRIFPHAIIPFVVLFCLASAQLVAQTGQDKKQAPAQNLGQNSSRDLKRMPKARELGRDLRVTRDLATGELRAVVPGGAAAAAPVTGPAIRASVALVGVGCTVIAPDRTRVPGLKAEDFHLWEDGAEQGIASFDAAATPAKIAVILDASPSVARELGDMRDAARSLERSLGAEDEVAVVSFADRATLLLPFSRNRALWARALASPALAEVANSSRSNIYRSVFLAARELFAATPSGATGGAPGRKAIILLTDGMDSDLGLTWDPATMRFRPQSPQRLAFDDVARELAAQSIELYVISTENRPRIMTDAWLADSRDTSLITAKAHEQNLPLYTLYLAELERQAGGGVYFLREVGSLAEVYHQIALGLSAEYTLGFYPGAAHPGWHSLRVELRRDSPAAASGARVIHRASYYVPATP